MISPENSSALPERARAVWNTTPLENVHSIITVASGKGGVGKSTTALYLALCAATAGKKVGLLDADIYGPSLPRMLGLSGKPAIAENKMVPHTAYGVQCMSVGFLTDEAAILRGPMIGKTLQQLLRGSAWGGKNAPLDVLFIDMPPGTGDIHLSMAQQLPLNGAIIVTTPQEIAVMDARKSASMFRKVGVPLLGVIENMHGYHHEDGTISYPFGKGGGEKLSQEFSIPLLTSIALYPEFMAACDAGTPITHHHPALASYAAALAVIGMI